MFAFGAQARDTPRSVARVKELLNAKQLEVRNIDDINEGNDCFYHTLRVGVSDRGRVTDTLAQLVDGVQQHEVNLQDMTAADLRHVAEKTIRWILNSTSSSFQELKDSIRAFIEVEAKEYLGALNRIPADSTYETGEMPPRALKGVSLHSCM
jgi:hypothetical protein